MKLFGIPAREGIGRAKSVPAEEYQQAYAQHGLVEMEERRSAAIAEKEGEAEDCMIREYKTIQEISGPLMVVDQRAGRHLRRAGRDGAA